MQDKSIILGFTPEGETIKKCVDELATSCLIKCDQCQKLLDIRGGPKTVLCKGCINTEK